MGMTLILLVDDEPALLRVMERALRAGGYVITSVPDPVSAVNLLQGWYGSGEVDCHLVIADFDLKAGMTGVDVLRRAQQLFPGAVRFLVTSRDEEGQAAVRDGIAHQFIAKPWASEEFRSAVSTAIAERRTGASS